MRDDLHKTVSLQPRWHKVLRLACQNAGDEAIRRQLEYATNQEINSGIRPALIRDLKEVFNNRSGNLFLSDEVKDFLKSVERINLSQIERNFCEVVRGLIERDGITSNLCDRALAETKKQRAQYQIELIASKINNSSGNDQASQARRILTSHTLKCNFEQERVKSPRKIRKSVKDLLDTPIGMR